MKKSVKDSYNLYKATAEEQIVDKSSYLKLTARFSKFLIQEVLDGKKVTLPARMGVLQIVGRKQEIKFDENGEVKGLAPDWVGTKKLWDRDPQAKKERKRVFHLNPHTQNFRYKFLWSKAGVFAENKTLYSLRMTRSNKRAASQRIKEGFNYVTLN